MATIAANTTGEAVSLCSQIQRCPSHVDALPLLEQLQTKLASLTQAPSGYAAALTILRFYLEHVAITVAPSLTVEQAQDVLDRHFLVEGVPASLALLATAALLDKTPL